MKKNLSKIIAAAMCASMMCSALPSAAYAAIPTGVSVSSIQKAESGKVIYSSDFEDGDVSAFTNRGDRDTTVISTTTEDAVSGSTSLLASGRSSSWNGPAFRLDTVCKPYTEYYISAKVKGKYYTNSMLSFQYTSDGKETYQNLATLNGNGWQTVENVKVSFTDEMTGVYVYFEGGTDDILIDDFSIVEVPSVEIENDLVSLKDVFANDFKVGTAITPSNLSSKPFMELVEKHFSGSLTAGNEMKPDAVLNHDACVAYAEETGDDTNPQVSFSAAKPFLSYCQKNNIPVRIHTLIWHSQTPDWFFKENYSADGEWVSEEKMLQRMENYIKNYFEVLTELYPDIDFYACDVVNEAWMEDGNPRQAGEQGSSGSAKSAWVQIFGDNSFIESAFTFARKYAPKGCKLYYNDYNEYMTGKMNAIVKMATELKEKGLIDGIGMQSHLDARQSLDAAFPSVSAYKKALQTYSELGLDIQITELDATIPENSGDQYLDVQAEYYKGIVDAIYEYKDSISALIVWGVTDDQSWRAKQQPLLFDAEYKAKPAFHSIVDGRVPVVPPVPMVVYGDSNCDGKIDMSDAVLIMQSLSNPDKYGLEGSDPTHITEKGLLNADCANVGDGVTNQDALAIQMLKLEIIDSLPINDALTD